MGIHASGTRFGSSKALGIPLLVAQETLLTLMVEFKCSWDSDGRYLAVEESKIAVFPRADTNREPLFRYEFVRAPQGRVPCAHLQVHAHRDAFTHLLAWCGDGSRRAKSRGGRALSGPIPAVSEFHFPLGGPRFRPCLEDVLDAIAEEFGVDTATTWPSVRDSARADWRRKQLGAAVRDAPEEAARVLRELGYRVTADEVHPDNLPKLTMR